MLLVSPNAHWKKRLRKINWDFVKWFSHDVIQPHFRRRRQSNMFWMFFSIMFLGEICLSLEAHNTLKTRGIGLHRRQKVFFLILIILDIFNFPITKEENLKLIKNITSFFSHYLQVSQIKYRETCLLKIWKDLNYRQVFLREFFGTQLHSAQSFKIFFHMNISATFSVGYFLNEKFEHTCSSPGALFLKCSAGFCQTTSNIAERFICSQNCVSLQRGFS